MITIIMNINNHHPYYHLRKGNTNICVSRHNLQSFGMIWKLVRGVGGGGGGLSGLYLRIPGPYFSTDLNLYTRT